MRSRGAQDALILFCTIGDIEVAREWAVALIGSPNKGLVSPKAAWNGHVGMQGMKRE